MTLHKFASKGRGRYHSGRKITTTTPVPKPPKGTYGKMTANYYYYLLLLLLQLLNLINHPHDREGRMWADEVVGGNMPKFWPSMPNIRTEYAQILTEYDHALTCL